MVSSVYLSTTRRMPFNIPEGELLAPPLPTGHFLATRPITPPPTQRVRSERPYAERARPDTSTLAAADYDVSVYTGFLPPEEPISRLELEGWTGIEECLEEGQREALELAGGAVGRLSDEWRQRVEQVSHVPIPRGGEVLMMETAPTPIDQRPVFPTPPTPSACAAVLPRAHVHPLGVSLARLDSRCHLDPLGRGE